jgi:hypothetical protein
MIGVSVAGAVNPYVQLGYTVADIVSKAGYGVLIFQIAVAKSAEHAPEAAVTA